MLEVENDNLNDKLEEKNKECVEYKQKYRNEIKLKEELLINSNNNKTDIEKFKAEINNKKRKIKT